MAKSVIKPSKPFITISGTYIVAEGYFNVNNPAIKVESFVFVQIKRTMNDDTTWYGVDAVPRVDYNGTLRVFIRDMNGSKVADGTKIQCDVLVVNE